MSFMNRLLSAALFTSLAVAGAIGQDQTALRTITIHTDDVDADSQPKTLTERLGRVDAAIRGRIVGSQVRFIREDVPPGVDPAYGIQPETEHIVEILEVLKGDSSLPAVGNAAKIVQPVGTVIVDGVSVVKDSDKIRAWLPGEELVLFVKRNVARSNFVVRTEDDSFLLSAGVVSTAGESPSSKAQRGVAIPEFLLRLRSAAAALQRP